MVSVGHCDPLARRIAMPMTDASKAALAAFFATRRGGKQLQEDIQKGLLAYFVAKTHPGDTVTRMYGMI